MSAVAGSIVGLALWALALSFGWAIGTMTVAMGAGAAIGVVLGGLYQNRKAI
ncbi:hypothetical protein GCM10008965_48530 [Methylorubrum aminovorans]